jgi:hypothetical protein
VRDLVNQLPRSSRLKTKLVDGDPVTDRWTTTDYLLAELIDATQLNTLVQAYKGTGKQLPRLKPVPRPTDKLRQQAELEALREEQRANFRAMAEAARRAGVMDKHPPLPDSPA